MRVARKFGAPPLPPRFAPYVQRVVLTAAGDAAIGKSGEGGERTRILCPDGERGQRWPFTF